MKFFSIGFGLLCAGLLAGATLQTGWGQGPATAPAAPVSPAAAAAPPGHSASRSERIAQWVQDRTGLPPAGVVLVISALPIVELRGSVPVGIALFHMNPALVYALSVAGNMLPVPLILWLFKPLSARASRSKLGRRFFDWLTHRARRKASEVEKYEFLGLAIFVAIPLPATGAWTGAMIGSLLGIRFGRAMASVLLGVLTAGGIMLVLSLLGWIGLAVALLALLAIGVAGVRRIRKTEHPAA